MSFRYRYLSALVATAALGLAPAHASQIAYEGFSPSFPIYANGGSGFVGPWVQGGINVSGSAFVPRERSLCFARLQLPSSDGSVSSQAFPAIQGALRTLAQPIGS